MCLIFLIKPQSYKTVVFAAKYQLKRVTVAILNCASFHSLWTRLCCLMNRKDKFLDKQCFHWNNEMFCGIKSCNTCSNAVARHWHTDTAPVHNRFAAGSLSCQWYVVWNQHRNPRFRYVNFATVVMETTQLVLSQLKKINKVSPCQK